MVASGEDFLMLFWGRFWHSLPLMAALPAAWLLLRVALIFARLSCSAWAVADPGKRDGATESAASCEGEHADHPSKCTPGESTGADESWVRGAPVPGSANSASSPRSVSTCYSWRSEDEWTDEQVSTYDSADEQVGTEMQH
jgi:hypothetical protein